MSLDVKELARTMTDAAREAVSDRWPQMQDLAETELRRLAQSLVDVGQLAADGKITESRARKLAHIHQISARSVLTTIDGLGLLAAEQVTQAAVRAVARVVNGALKFALL